MAATVSAWAKPGAWALDSEENETELLQQHKQDADAANGHSNGAETTEFPSLAAAAAKKTKKKKGQTLSLQEFTTYGAPKPSAAQPKGLTPDELLVLPTGPRQRSAEELDRNKLGGGFRSYGGGMRDEQPRRQGSFNRSLIVNLCPLGLMKLMIGVRGRSRLLIMGLRGGTGEKEGGFSRIRNRGQMKLIIGRRTKVLFPRSLGDMRGEGVSGWNLVMVVQIQVIG
ncbi:UNVERIFIED_CONTAM: Eukaryotic translation initiation factor 4B3 [Sesamum latifolium]|uniref:Eukaryotic translation initiation factor 4B3 n=1 Tax=Sesamum latifolium TaxID=2727402 RepID=A0AAW2V5R7_9LAMI